MKNFNSPTKGKLDLDGVVKEIVDYLKSDPEQKFQLIIGSIIDVEGTYGVLKRTIGELLLIASHRVDEAGISAESAHNRLRRMGIMIQSNMIYFSNTSQSIKELIRATSWASNHSKILERLPNAEKSDPKTYCPGLKSRGVAVPLDIINLVSESVQVNEAKTSTNDLPF